MAEDQGQRIIVKIGGKETVVRLNSFDGHDIKACRGETGHAPQYWFQHPDEWDLDIIAMFVYLTRRKLSPQTTYDKVLDSINYDNFEVETVGGEDEDDPES